MLPLRARAAESAAALLGGSAAPRGSFSPLHGSADGSTAGRCHCQRGSGPFGSFCGDHGDKKARKGRVLLPPLRDPGERPDTSSEDAGRAGSTPILDPKPEDDRTHSFGKETRPKNLFFFFHYYCCASFGCSKSMLSMSAESAPRSLRAPPSAERRLGPGEKPRGRLAARARGSWVEPRP